MNRKHEPLYPGQRIGEYTLISTYISKRIRYWKAKCSCGNYRVLRDGNLKRGATTKCTTHISRRLANITRIKPGVLGSARIKLRNKYGMEEAWLKDIVAFAEVYTAKYAGEDLVPRIDGNPIGPANYKFVPKLKVVIDCKDARDRAAKWLGQKAYEVSKQYVYQFLKRKENET